MNEYPTKLDNDKSYTNGESIKIFRNTFDAISLTDTKIAKVINPYFTASSTNLNKKKTKVFKVISNNDEQMDDDNENVEHPTLEEIFKKITSMYPWQFEWHNIRCCWKTERLTK
ncbi:MAG: hypothetical protein Ta2E_10550 [Mycoplasmoidaceae bacterium]|nr:MAG: hypothetical protein Ta2E_10550 [Mycoplasmoidaceae bacterium]